MATFRVTSTGQALGLSEFKVYDRNFISKKNMYFSFIVHYPLATPSENEEEYEYDYHYFDIDGENEQTETSKATTVSTRELLFYFESSFY